MIVRQLCLCLTFLTLDGMVHHDVCSKLCPRKEPDLLFFINSSDALEAIESKF